MNLVPIASLGLSAAAPTIAAAVAAMQAAEAARIEAVAAKEEAEDISGIAVPDDVVKVLVEDDESDTSGALGKRYARYVVPDGTDGAALSDADIAATGIGCILLTPGVYTASANLTINAPVMFQPGASLQPASGVTVILAGGVTAPRRQVFDQSAGGIAAPRRVDFYHPEWWGPVGTADDSATWTAMIAAMSATSVTVNTVPMSQRIMAPAGLNRIMGITLQNCELYADKGLTAFAPPATAGTGSMIKTNGYTTIHGGYFLTTDPTQAVCLVDLQGYRDQVESLYIIPSAASSIGLRLGNGFSITPVVKDVRIIGGTNATGSIGLYNYTSDAECTNVWVATCDIGVYWKFGGALIGTLHVWGNNTGMSGGMDGCMITNLYLDSNLGWGADIPNTDRCSITNMSAWNNGKGIAGTGAMRVQKVGSNSCRGLQIGQAIFDDNVGTALLLDGVDDVQIDAQFTSRTVAGGGSAVADTGLLITAACTNVRANLRGHANYFLTSLVNDQSAAASIEFARIKKLVPADVTGTGTAFSVNVGPSEQWLVEGALVVDGDQTEDLKARLQSTNCPNGSGWFALQGPAIASVSTTADSVNPAGVVTVASSAGSYSSVGTVGVGTRQMIPFRGYVNTGAGAASTARLDLTWGKVTDNGLTLTLHAGSWFQATRIA